MGKGQLVVSTFFLMWRRQFILSVRNYIITSAYKILFTSYHLFHFLSSVSSHKPHLWKSLRTITKNIEVSILFLMDYMNYL